MHTIVMAKQPVPGRVKTRLCPPCTFEQAASVAEAALADTLDVVVRVPGVSPVAVLEGHPSGSWLPPGVPVLPQRGEGLAERIAAAFDDVGAPSLLIGMDTPQITLPLLADACSRLASGDVDAVLGPAEDGGWWAIGLREADQRAFRGVPMSTDGTADAQRARLRELGLTFVELPVLRDVDDADDARFVAATIPRSRFARAVARSPIGAVEAVTP